MLKETNWYTQKWYTPFSYSQNAVSILNNVLNLLLTIWARDQWMCLTHVYTHLKCMAISLSGIQGHLFFLPLKCVQSFTLYLCHFNSLAILASEEGTYITILTIILARYALHKLWRSISCCTLSSLTLTPLLVYFLCYCSVVDYLFLFHYYLSCDPSKITFTLFLVWSTYLPVSLCLIILLWLGKSSHIACRSQAYFRICFSSSIYCS